MKAVIPVAGVGSRLRPHTHTHPKALIPVAGKPILAHIIDALAEAGCKDFVFIIGYLGEKIQDYIHQAYPSLNSNFIVQTNRKGIGHALWLAKKHYENEDEVIIALGDTIFDMNMKSFLKLEHSALGTKRVDDPRSFGVAETGSDGFICKLIEKPAIPKSNIALVGIYKINEVRTLIRELEYLIENDIRTKNEYQLTDALMRMIENGAKFMSYNVENWFDCGKKEALLETNAILLKRQGKQTTGQPQTEDCIIIQPVNIAKSCIIKHSIVGPNVSIGENARIDYSIIKNSIIGPYASIKNAVLHDSLIGDDASLKGQSQSLNLGDSTEINFDS